MKKTVIVSGAPEAGKTTEAARLAKATGAKVIHTDDYLHIEREARPAAVAAAAARHKNVIVEGTDAVRTIKAGLVPDEIVHMEGGRRAARGDKSLHTMNENRVREFGRAGGKVKRKRRD